MTGRGGGSGRDRDAEGRARNARPRDALGRPLPRPPAAGDPAGGVAPVDPPPLPPEAALDRAQALLDAGRPFEAHEVLEAVWKAPGTPAGDRPLWRGLAQLTVGITHVLRGNRRGGEALLRRAAESLQPVAGGTPYSVDVDGLRSWATRSADALQAAGPTGDGPAGLPLSPPPLRG